MQSIDRAEKPCCSPSTVLTERAQLFWDTQGLKQQNAELRMLLQKSLNAKVHTLLLTAPRVLFCYQLLLQ